MILGNARVSRERLIGRIWKERWAYLFLAPFYAPFILFILVPTASGLILSLYEAGLTGQRFIGFENFVRLLNDEAFVHATINTFLLVVGIVPAVMVVTLAAAVMIFPLPRVWQSFFRLAYYIPIVASGIILSMIWLWIYDPNFGLANHLLSVLGMKPVLWLDNTNTALPSVMLVLGTMMLGQPIILFLAGLGNIPPELYDAVKVDGANDWTAFRFVTLPLLKPVMLFVLVTQTFTAFQVWVIVLIMTRGGPAYATETIAYRVYLAAFQFYRFGYASAMAVVMLVIAGTIGLIQLRLMGEGG